MFNQYENENQMLRAVICSQDDYIAELEQRIEDLQKALDAVLLNKCRTRKVKVKVYGKSKQT